MQIHREFRPMLPWSDPHTRRFPTTDWRETHTLVFVQARSVVLFVEGAREEGVMDRVWVPLVNFVLALPASDLWRVMRGDRAGSASSDSSRSARSSPMDRSSSSRCVRLPPWTRLNRGPHDFIYELGRGPWD